MRQVWIPRSGPPEVLELREAPDPEPGPGEARIRVAYAGINFADLMARRGMYPDAPRMPFVPGYEVSGAVDAVGAGVGTDLLGRRVISTTRFGGYSDVVCVPAEQALPIPDSLGDREAAALPVNYLTAHHMLVTLCGVRTGETVLVHAAAGGVGSAAIQLCKIAGARVIGTASPPKHAFLRSLGVDPVDYRRKDWPRAVRELTAGRGVDIALDAVGGASFRRSYDLLAPTGRLCCFGVSAMVHGERRGVARVLRVLWEMPRFRPLRLMNDNRGVFGINLAHLWRERERLGGQLRTLIGHATAGRIAPLVDGAFPFERAAEAHRRLDSRASIGKVLLEA